MVKRKQNQPPKSGEILLWVGIAVIVLIALFFAVTSFWAFLRHSSLFTIKDVIVAENLGKVEITELQKLKGRNIFEVDPARLEEKIRAKYPQVAALKVLRRFPDQIAINGFRRESFALVVFDGRIQVVSRDGCLIGSPTKETQSLPLIKGLQKQKILIGEAVRDDSIQLAFQVVEVIQKDPVLSEADFSVVNIEDLTRIVCVFGQDKTKFEVIVDKDDCLVKLKTLSVMLGRRDIELSNVKYIDLRFEEPVIGKKKIGK